MNDHIDKKVNLEEVIKKLTVTLLIAFLVSVACSQKVIEVEPDDLLKVNCFLSDSLGIQREMFDVDEDIYLHFVIENATNDDKNV